MNYVCMGQEITAKPGRILENSKANKLYASFVKKYRTRKKLRRHDPTWWAFPEPRIRVGKHVIGKDIFEHPIFQEYQTLILIVEASKKVCVYEANFQQIKNFFAKRHPSETGGEDIYMLDTEQKWCLAYTFEDEAGHDVLLLTGEIERFKNWLQK